jgi:hypothetical protein
VKIDPLLLSMANLRHSAKVKLSKYDGPSFTAKGVLLNIG